jgi:hypothetical protein
LEIKEPLVLIFRKCFWNQRTSDFHFFWELKSLWFLGVISSNHPTLVLLWTWKIEPLNLGKIFIFHQPGKDEEFILLHLSQAEIIVRREIQCVGFEAFKVQKQLIPIV